MKTILIILACFLLTSCFRATELLNRNRFKEYEIINIDGCQYIQYGTSEFLEVTHKGNCDNPRHLRNIMQQGAFNSFN